MNKIDAVKKQSCVLYYSCFRTNLNVNYTYRTVACGSKTRAFQYFRYLVNNGVSCQLPAPWPGTPRRVSGDGEVFHP